MEGISIQPRGCDKTLEVSGESYIVIRPEAINL